MNAREFEGKTILVTGGESGIGRRCVEMFLEAGGQVVAAGIDQQQLDVLRTAHAGTPIFCRRVDVGSEREVQELFAEPELAPGIDVLVNCAGIQRLGNVEETTLQDWESTFRVNVTGTFLTARAAVPLMRRRGGGAIVNVSSIHARVTAGARVAYVASKTAVLGLTRALAMDHGVDGIRVNCVLPGVIDTPMLSSAWERLRGDRSLGELQASVEDGTPLRRIGTSSDVAHAILYLSSMRAAFVTGLEMTVDGGVVNKLALSVQTPSPSRRG